MEINYFSKIWLKNLVVLPGRTWNCMHNWAQKKRILKVPIAVLLKVSWVQEIDSSDGLTESTKELFVVPFNVELMEAWGHFSEDLLYHIKELWENKQLSENFWSICSKSSINPSLIRPLNSVPFSRSVVSNSATPLTTACQASLTTINSRSLLKLLSIESVMHLILCHSLLLPSIFPSIRVFSNVSVLYIKWAKYWSFSFSISPSDEYSGLISFIMDWLDLLAVQRTLKSILQHHSSKAWILRCSVFFIVQLSHLYMTTGKTIPLTRWTCVGKVMSPLFFFFLTTNWKQVYWDKYWTSIVWIF